MVPCTAPRRGGGGALRIFPHFPAFSPNPGDRIPRPPPPPPPPAFLGPRSPGVLPLPPNPRMSAR